MSFKNSFISFHCDTKFVGTQITAGFPKNSGCHTPLPTTNPNSLPVFEWLTAKNKTKARYLIYYKTKNCVGSLSQLIVLS